MTCTQIIYFSTHYLSNRLLDTLLASGNSNSTRVKCVSILLSFDRKILKDEKEIEG